MLDLRAASVLTSNLKLAKLGRAAETLRPPRSQGRIDHDDLVTYRIRKEPLAVVDAFWLFARHNEGRGKDHSLPVADIGPTLNFEDNLECPTMDRESVNKVVANE